MLRGSSVSLLGGGIPALTPQGAIVPKSWSELHAFFQRERQGEGREHKNEHTKQLQEYRGWVFSAVDCIVDRFSSVGFGFYRVDTGEQLTSSSKFFKAITKPLLYPNEMMTFDFVKGWTQTQLDLCGMAAILIKRNALGKPWELWPFDMNYFVGVEVAKNNPLAMPTGFTFRLSDEDVTFPVEDVIWLRYPHPKSLWEGFSPIQAQAYITDIDYYLEVYESSFFKNSARGDFIIETEGNLDDDQAQRLKDEWQAAYGGIRKSYQPIVTSGGVKVVPMNLSAKDFEFLEMSRWTKDRVLSAYRVPEGKLGLFKDINRANQKGIDIAFNEGAISPRCRLWDVEITKQLIWEFSPLVELRHDNPVPRDREMDLKELELRGGRVPINTPDELRNWWDGSKPVDGGDVILIDKKLVPLTEAGQHTGGSEDTGEGGDKPGDGADTPDYDTENDPGGDESDKAYIQIDWEQVLAPIMWEYDTALAHTAGWSQAKAEHYARERMRTRVGGELLEIFVEGIVGDADREVFKKGVVLRLKDKISKHINEGAVVPEKPSPAPETPPENREITKVIAKLDESLTTLGAKISSMGQMPEREPVVVTVNSEATVKRSDKIVKRDDEGKIVGMEEVVGDTKIMKRLVRDDDGRIVAVEETIGGG